MGCDIRIGCSGWHYKHWRGPFYSPNIRGDQMLSHYLQHFDSVEVNNSFYRLPTDSAVIAWRDSTPDRFLFAVKASRFITHNKKLSDPDSAFDKFFSRVDILGPKLGPILFQLPPKWRLNLERLRSFLEALPPGHRYTFEFREPSWHQPEVYDLLRSHNAAYCIYELDGFQTPFEITADFTYVRLHGPGGKYQGSYSSQVLSAWAERIGQWRRSLKGIYVYFDNDQEAFAAHNALELKRLAGLH
jgi:uncharacterized protein YecE (DUF72 family)